MKKYDKKVAEWDKKEGAIKVEKHSGLQSSCQSYAFDVLIVG